MSILEKKITCRTSIFPELLILKNVVTWMPESSCFRTLFGSKPFKASQTLLKSPQEPFYVNFPLISKKVRRVSSVLVGSEMLGWSFNMLAAHHMYSCRSREKFPQQVPSQLPAKPKIFSQRFIVFLKST